MKRMGWLLCAALLPAANVFGVEAPPPAVPAPPAVVEPAEIPPLPPAPAAPALPTAPVPAAATPALPTAPVPAAATPALPAAPVPPFPVPPRVPGPAAPAAAVPAGVPTPAGGPVPFPRAVAPAPAPAVSHRVPAVSVSSPPAGRQEGGAGFFVKFNNADIYEVIHTLGRTAGINYLIDPRVRGVVNVHTQGVVRKDGALDLLFAILRINGATAIREGETYHIVPMAEAKMEPLFPSFAGDNAAKSPSNQVVMRAFPLQYIGVAEMGKVIKPFLSAGGEAVEVARANILLVIDTAGNLEKTSRLVDLFDSEVFRSAGMKLFRLRHIDPEEMARNLDNIFGALDFSSTRAARPAGINFVAVPRLNSLLVVSASPKTMEDVEKWIGELDREGSGASRAIHRYRVKYGKVKDIIAVLEKLYPKRTAAIADRTTEFKPAVAQAPGSAISPASPQSPPRPAPGPAASPAAASKDGKDGKEGEGFDIIPDEPTNSLILRASLSEYTDILENLKAIDVYPQQVLLEVLVGEVNLKDDLKLGIDWKWQGTRGDGYSQTATLATAPGLAVSNFSYLVEKTGRLTAAFRSLAENGRASVLSSPSVIATNGKKSRINVADQVPVVTSTLLSNTNPPVTTTTVEYRDVGVILSFTPFINDFGLVTLEIEQEVSEVSSTSSGSNPTFFKRSISTNLIASQDQSIVLGGLVKERKSLDRSGLPWIYKIPLIGWLFGSREDSVSRNELLIFITPRVIRNVEEGIQLSRDFEERVQQLKGRMVETQGIRLKGRAAPRAPEPAAGPPPGSAHPQ